VAAAGAVAARTVLHYVLLLRQLQVRALRLAAAIITEHQMRRPLLLLLLLLSCSCLCCRPLLQSQYCLAATCCPVYFKLLKQQCSIQELCQRVEQLQAH
jgi:hypothetical protein